MQLLKLEIFKKKQFTSMLLQFQMFTSFQIKKRSQTMSKKKLLFLNKILNFVKLISKSLCLS